MTAPARRDDAPHCDASFGVSPNPEKHRRCGRKATHLAIDDEGGTYRFCARCVRAFEGGMTEVRLLLNRRRSDRAAASTGGRA